MKRRGYVKIEVDVGLRLERTLAGAFILALLRYTYVLSFEAQTLVTDAVVPLLLHEQQPQVRFDPILISSVLLHASDR